MTKEQIECIRQIAETAGLLSRQLGILADSFHTSVSDTATGGYKQQDTITVQTPPIYG